MNFFILLLIAAFHLLNNAMADWGLSSPLILTRILPDGELKFPSVVSVIYTDNQLQCPVTVYSDENANTTVTYVCCPRLNDESWYCNYPESFFEIPRETCDSQVLYRRAPIVGMLNILAPDTCTHNKRTGYMYKFEYLVCKESLSHPQPTVIETVRIYNMCYQDDTFKQIIIGHYTIDTPRLLAEPLLQDEQNYEFQEFHAEPLPDYYFYYWKITMEHNTNFKARSVLPPEWVPFGPQRKAFYNYMNAAPMSDALVQRWETLMKNMKLKLSKMNEAIHVTAGLLDVKKNHKLSIKYLGDIAYLGLHQIPGIKVPYGFWVLIYNQNLTAGVAIIMHNKRFTIYKAKPKMSYYVPDEKICSLSVCSLANISDIFPTRGLGLMYCCHPNFIVKEFNLVVNETNLLQFPIA